MLTYLRYTLATCCFAASVGCLALWWPSWTSRYMAYFPYPSVPLRVMYLETFRGSLVISSQVFAPPKSAKFATYWKVSAQEIPADFNSIDCRKKPVGRFGYTNGGGIFAPLWYPGLVFALAGVAALRLGSRFTLRSAIIATTVVAGLLGMAVVL